MKRALGLVAVLVVSGAPALALAGGPSAPPVGEPRRAAAGSGAGVAPAQDEKTRERLREQVLDQMRAMRMWKMTEELKLDEAAAAKIFPLLAKFDEKARELGRQRREVMRAIEAELAKDKPEDARIAPLVERLAASRAQRRALDDEKWQALRGVLTPVQQAKLLLLLPRIEESFHRRIREAMGEPGGAGAGGADGTKPFSDREKRRRLRLGEPTREQGLRP